MAGRPDQVHSLPLHRPPAPRGHHTVRVAPVQGGHQLPGTAPGTQPVLRAALPAPSLGMLRVRATKGWEATPCTDLLWRETEHCSARGSPGPGKPTNKQENKQKNLSSPCLPRPHFNHPKSGESFLLPSLLSRFSRV